MSELTQVNFVSIVNFEQVITSLVLLRKRGQIDIYVFKTIICYNNLFLFK